MERKGKKTIIIELHKYLIHLIWYKILEEFKPYYKIN